MATSIHPFIKFVYDHAPSAIYDIADKAGISRTSILRWKNGTSPRLMDLEAVFEVLGFELVIAKKHRPDFNPEREAILVHEVKRTLNSISPGVDNTVIAREIVVKISAALEGQTCLDLTQECLNHSTTIKDQVKEINHLIGRVSELESAHNRRNGMAKALREMSIGEEKEFIAGERAKKVAASLRTTARQVGVRVKTRIVRKDATVYVQVTRVGE